MERESVPLPLADELNQPYRMLSCAERNDETSFGSFVFSTSKAPSCERCTDTVSSWLFPCDSSIGCEIDQWDISHIFALKCLPYKLELRSVPPTPRCFFSRAFSLGSVRSSDRESWLSKLLHVRTIDPGKSSHSITLADPKAEKIYELQIHCANPKDRDQYIGV